ncbi:acetyl/propionyl/methylcrotonyl-CoA carboxylase subunit alpha [Pseudorhizobium halotolerans]|uniref:Acetyl/propionyl/methylcrotonyl-CoA carboxylase subunit alpha n=1 Tax=Pseudorhizobium halotolerans TaxID=1233081 RepID=A0ABM8PJ20_9HYPH|nr:acetyl/propionyl/methylcrotonyl-CoA carboxylase subunit alpha [Pseudorhizobium halotolerans]CAD7032830.1 acetyl/propionyl/methylcrotonyl-CoA carboxylase subunit alpha [Pseudorhizobium halotolerans]
MFQKILIANRGEIACRVITTAARMGIKTVAIYSDADVRAKHVAMADEAVRIGPAAVAESYLQGQKIIEAALHTGAQAIHPGYGFLSENPDFVEAVEAAGLVFIGPPASAIRAMGLKDAAKALMAEAGVPVVPGYHGERPDPDFLAAEAGKIGYPVLIKARAGGGGKGMRLVEKPADFMDALAGARREGQASFGDPTCLIEKYITHPRHIEIQVFGDGHGNVIHLFERDCSLQRRHQKVIEEAPAPGMPAAVREAMGKAAVEAARAIGYTGAGTVEFIVDGSGPLREDGFWFMEMNTRLQVEHPVSEAITGFDFVELQLRIAAGEPLPVRQDDLAIDGWAFEARVYAEDVPKGFLPATGRLEHLHFSSATAFEAGPVRIDAGVRQGDEISPWYDPMIAKVIVHGPTRSAALNMLSSALEECRIVGSVTNVEFLAVLSRHEGFRRGEVDTGLIARDLSELMPVSEPSLQVLALAALGGLNLLRAEEGSDPWDSLVGWRHWSAARQFVHLESGDRCIEAQVTNLGQGRFTVSVMGETVMLNVMVLGGPAVRVETDGHQFNADIVRETDRVSVFVSGRSFSFGLADALSDVDEEQAAGDTITAPMPGLVRAVYGRPGASVTKGEALLVLEAMKMEHTLFAPRDGVVSEVLAAEGDQVTNGTLLLALEPQGE